MSYYNLNFDYEDLEEIDGSSLIDNNDENNDENNVDNSGESATTKASSSGVINKDSNKKKRRRSPKQPPDGPLGAKTPQISCCCPHSRPTSVICQ